MKDYSEKHSIQHYEEYTRHFETRYCALISHSGLNKHRTVKDLNGHILLAKIENAFETWDNQYHRKVLQKKKAANKETAESLDNDVKNTLKNLDTILLHTLDIDDTVDWDVLKDDSTFDKPKPILVELNDLLSFPKKPDESKYKAKLNLLEKIVPSLSAKKIAKAEKKYKEVLDSHEQLKKNIRAENKKIERLNNEIILEHEKRVQSWQEELDSFEKSKAERNSSIDKLREEYSKGVPNAITQYCEIVLNNSDYSNFDFPQDFNLEYSEENKTIVLDFMLPSIDDLPKVKSVKFIATRNEIQERVLSDRELARLYDSLVYQLTLRTIHELFEADTSDFIEAIGFNGWVNSVNKATGKEDISCIVSIHTTKSEFLDIDLSKVEPKQCFKGLKGIGSSKLSSITPIKPILQLNKNDKRFVLGQDVVDKLDEGFNLAIMEWEDFEHLVRELFEKEFSVNGGEVKVTQSSRDGGVDAIAFDPDPIRGGKIVIQAKRYTNVVGVSAVRDLYGTTVNEGAIKGILVTTSDYGTDAHKFAKDKPLTLLNGNNLLHLLGKHGHKARINIAEARKLREGL